MGSKTKRLVAWGGPEDQDGFTVPRQIIGNAAKAIGRAGNMEVVVAGSFRDFGDIVKRSMPDYLMTWQEMPSIANWSAKRVYVHSGWFPHYETYAFDRLGNGVHSSLVGEYRPSRVFPEEQVIEEQNRLTQEAMDVEAIDPGKAFTLLVLQEPYDTVLGAAPESLRDQRALIAFVRQRIPPEHELHVSQHPHIRSWHIPDGMSALPKGVVYHPPEDRATAGLMKAARMVVGLNSTALLTAAIIHRLPTVALGRGVYSGNQILWEPNLDEPLWLPERAIRDSNQRAQRWLLGQMLDRQVSRDEKSDEVIYRQFVKYGVPDEYI